MGGRLVRWAAFAIVLLPALALVLTLCIKFKLDPLPLASGLLRVWGWLTWRNGPMIDSIHFEKIEFVDR